MLRTSVLRTSVSGEMMKEINLDTMRCISLFESITDAYVDDCVRLQDKIIFIVKKGQISKAIGKGGSNINRVRSAFKNKKIYVIESDDTIEGFIKNMYPKIDVKVEIKDTSRGKLALIKVDRLKRGAVIGKNGEKIKTNRLLLRRRFDCDLKVV